MDKTITTSFGIAAAVMILIAIIATYFDSLPPHWETVCTHYHSEEYTYFMLVGKVLIPLTSTHDVCDATELQCVAGSDYAGPIQCK